MESDQKAFNRSCIDIINFSAHALSSMADPLSPEDHHLMKPVKAEAEPQTIEKDIHIGGNASYQSKLQKSSRIMYPFGL